MKRRLSLSENILIGSLLFGLFFGAGNLIFPVELGQQSGTNGVPAIIGFLISGVGLAVLGVVASAISKSESLYEMAKPVSDGYGKFFTCLLYLTIGPFFAIPRTATASYEVGVRAFVSESNLTMWLFIFSLIFFSATLFFSLKPGKLIDIIGKYMTSIFLILLSILIVLSIVNPMGEFAVATPTEKYQQNPITVGLLDGYNTMDALAALAFAIIIITNIRKLGVTEPKDIALETAKSGIVCVIGMSLVYAFLAYMGSTSVNLLDGDNGGILLSQMSNHYLGSLGKILLAGIVISACLKTAIGLISACSQMFAELFPNSLSYKNYAILFTLISFGIANLGLAQIISLSIPVLMFLYPLSITLMILSLLVVFIKKDRHIYRWTTGFTAAAALLDFFKAAPEFISSNPLVTNILNFGENYLPGYELGFGWVIPALIGFVVGVIFSKAKKA